MLCLLSSLPMISFLSAVRRIGYVVFWRDMDPRAMGVCNTRGRILYHGILAEAYCKEIDIASQININI